MQRATAVALGVMMTLVPVAARAEGLSWQVVDVVPGEPTERVAHPPPSIKVRVIGDAAPGPDARDSWRLELEPADNPARLRSVAPSSVIPYAKSGDSLAVVVLVEGHQYYFGNDQYVLADGVVDGMIQKRSAGVYSPIVAALDQMGTISENPASKGGLIVYSVGSDVRQALGPLADLTGDKLGAQELQRGKTSRELADGLRASLAQLRGVTATRKVLFVISDGFDVGGVDEIRALRRQFDAEQIDIFAFHFEAPTQFIPVNDGEKERNRQVMQTLTSNGNGAYWQVRNGDALAQKLGEAIARINARFYLIFPGQVTDARTRLKSGFEWDGKERAVRLLRDEEPVGETSPLVVFMPVWGQVKPASRLWMWIVFPLGGVLLVGGLVMLLSRKKPPAPAPLPVAVAAPPPAPPQSPSIQPVPGGAFATQALNITSGDGVPVVGWLVPINGPQQFQTLKLSTGVTKVGNAHGSHIIIQDAFMSGEHAHVVMSPAGFTLIDNGSTNGTFVNERRVQRHDLIDNDVIKFGKTDCKFKTINTDA